MKVEELMWHLETLNKNLEVRIHFVDAERPLAISQLIADKDGVTLYPLERESVG